ncbi:MAG: DinB family protein [Flavisolibacter sp.]
MTKEEICTSLIREHRAFAAYTSSLDDRQFLFAPPGKWTAGQQLDHIIRSVSAVRQALTIPKFILSLIFPKANRPSKDYEGLVEKYKSKLKSGGRAAGRFIPKKLEPRDKKPAVEKLNNQIQKLCGLLNRYSEDQLNTFVLPHPLLGKLTLREMLYFTIYHVQHHHKLVMTAMSAMGDE